MDKVCGLVFWSTLYIGYRTAATVYHYKQKKCSILSLPVNWTSAKCRYARCYLQS